MNKTLKNTSLSFYNFRSNSFSLFLYGYFTFEGIKKIDICSEFQRFKFYDDVFISHFFISGLLLMVSQLKNSNMHRV